MNKRTRMADETGWDSLNPRSDHAQDATHFRRIIAAQRALEASREGLARAVNEAREAGDSWTIIGAALGVSKQAAQQRFGT